MFDRATCEEMVRRMPALLDGEVTPAERARLEDHLHTCVRCLRKFHFERTVLDGIRRVLSDAPVPPPLRVRLEALVRGPDERFP